MKIDPSKFLSLYSDLPCERRGVLITLMCMIMARGKPILAKDIHYNLRMGKAKADKILAELASDNLISIADGFINQADAHAEIARQNDIKSKRSKAGFASKLARSLEQKPAPNNNTDFQQKSTKSKACSKHMLEQVCDKTDENEIDTEFSTEINKNNDLFPTHVITSVSCADARTRASHLEPNHNHNNHDNKQLKKPHQKNQRKVNADIFIKLYNEYARKMGWQKHQIAPDQWMINRISFCIADIRKNNYKLQQVLEKATEQRWLNQIMSPKTNLRFFTRPASKAKESVINKIMNGDYDDPTGEFNNDKPTNYGGKVEENPVFTASRRISAKLRGQQGESPTPEGEGCIDGTFTAD